MRAPGRADRARAVLFYAQQHTVVHAATVCCRRVFSPKASSSGIFSLAFDLFYHASSSTKPLDNTGFYFSSCFILPHLMRVKCGKICGKIAIHFRANNSLQNNILSYNILLNMSLSNFFSLSNITPQRGTTFQFWKVVLILQSTQAQYGVITPFQNFNYITHNKCFFIVQLRNVQKCMSPWHNR